MRPPASTTAMVWAAASWRLARRAIQRSGCGTGSTVPRSGQVPTTTSAPSSCSRLTAWSRCRTATGGFTRWVTSLAPIITTARSGRLSAISSTWPDRSLLRAPTTATRTSCTGRSAHSASPAASIAPGVWCGWSTPSPQALESPSITIRNGSPAWCAP